MLYDLTPVPSTVTGDRVEWDCPCGSRLGLGFARDGAGSIGYEVGGESYPVTGGAGVLCPACGRRFFLAAVAPEPSVTLVSGRP
jgi:hypothetical protein